jgi:hypothetical protein
MRFTIMVCLSPPPSTSQSARRVPAGHGIFLDADVLLCSSFACPPCLAMPVVAERVHPKGMDFANQRKVVMLRTVQKVDWKRIATAVKNLQGGRPSIRLCQRTLAQFRSKRGRRAYKYANCGRKAWKVTKETEKFLVRRLLTLRRSCVCTSTTLQRELVRDMGTDLDTSTIRKVLLRHGYRWLPRAQKPKHSKEVMAARLAFANEVLTMSHAQLERHVAMCMDGVVLSVPPANPLDRENYCRVGETRMWRKRDEAAKPDLAGGDAFSKQIPYARAVPMWGGIGPGGFGLVMFHEHKKVTQDEWAKAVRAGKLTAACKAARRPGAQGGCRVLCDNETFLTAPASRAAHRRARVELWQIPPRSPDLNPVEKFWGWLRSRLRAMDMADLKAKRPPIEKSALKARVRALCQTVKAKTVARNIFKTLRKTCAEVALKRGAASRG